MIHDRPNLVSAWRRIVRQLFIAINALSFMYLIVNFIGLHKIPTLCTFRVVETLNFGVLFSVSYEVNIIGRSTGRSRCDEFAGPSSQQEYMG